MRFSMVLSADGQGAISMDGKDVGSAVSAVQLNATVGQRPTVVLDVNVVELAAFDLEEPEVIIPDQVAELLVLLGWTPPIAAEEPADRKG